MHPIPNLRVVENKIKNINQIECQRVLRQKDIYHYTSASGMANILESGKLWFSDVFSMNDEEEIVDGINVITHVEEKMEMKGVIEVLDNVLIAETKKRHFFVCCFSMGYDELPIWQYYTKDVNSKGYNLAFDYRKLLRSIVYKNRNLLDGCTISFGKIEYSRRKKVKYTDNIYSEFVKNYAGLNEQIFHVVLSKFPDSVHDNVADEIIERYQQYCIDKSNGKLPAILAYNGDKLQFEKSIFVETVPFYKKQFFSFEKEVRIVIEVPEEKLTYLKEKGVYKIRQCNNFSIPYLELEYDRKSIQGIMLSHKVDEGVATYEVRDCCKKNGINVEDLERGIKKSDIKMRY